jgi:PhnB protein
MWTACTSVLAADYRKGEAMQVQPYLSFEGRCDEAVEFYRTALGAEVEMLMRFKDSPDQSMITAESAEKVMHVCMRIGDSLIMASDGRCTGKMGFTGISLALTVSDDAEADQRFSALMEGGQVTMPLMKTFFSSKFGMVVDKFGVQWMILVGQ